MNLFKVYSKTALAFLKNLFNQISMNVPAAVLVTPMPPVLIMKGRTLAPVTQVMPAMVLAAQVRLHHLHQFLTTATEINVSS